MHRYTFACPLYLGDAILGYLDLWLEALQLLEGLKSGTDPDSSIEVPYLLAMTACARARAKDKATELFQEGKQNANFRVK